MKYWVGTALLVMVVGGIVWYPHKAVVYAPQNNITSDVTFNAQPILFVGDIMLGRYVETLGERYGNPAFVFASTTELLESHTTIANLEGPIPKEHVPTPINGFRFSFPLYVPALLQANGIAAVSLANNHMFDYGEDGWEDTKRALNQSNVVHFGGYAPTQEDYFATTLGGKQVIVYGITMIATGWDEEQALLVTNKIRKEHPDAYLIAFLHWGDEYVTQNEYQQSFAHKLIDRGVDTIVGSHPHVVQGVEVYKGKPIFYSLGNFIFDQYWDSNVEKGYVLEIKDSGKEYVYTLIPIQSSHSIPHVADEKDREIILNSIASQSSSELQSAIQSGTVTLSHR